VVLADLDVRPALLLLRRRRSEAALAVGSRKALWIIALFLAPVLSWIVYGFWRMRQNRGLPSF
jgi:hypothetical protein